MQFLSDSPQSSEPIQSTKQATHNGYEIPLHELHTSTNGIYTAETQVIKKTEMSLLRFLCVQIPYKPKLYMNYTSTNDVHTN